MGVNTGTWKTSQVRDLASYITVGFVGSMSSVFVNTGVPLLRGQNILPYSLDMTNLKYISKETHRKWKKSALQPGDVAIVRVGYPGTACVIPGGLGDLNAASLVIVRPNPELLDSDYLCYVLNSPWGKAQIKGRLVGSAQQVFNTHTAAELEIPAPPLPTQRKIAAILSAYDDLIENNRRRIALLEQAARVLYEEWFVRLKFPGHERTRIVNGVPEGWKRKPLGELTSFLKRGITPHYADDAEGLVINQKCIRDGRLDINLARHQSREFAFERQVQVGDVLVNSTGEGTLGRIAQVKVPVEHCTVDTHVTIVRPVPELGVHYFGIAVCAWEPRFSTMGRGATNQTELSPAAISDSGITVPSTALVAEFESFADPLSRQVSNLVAQNDRIRAARDLLLPRLMSGEIAVDARTK